MKCMIYSDVHWSTTTSLVRSQGTDFSTRLEYLINGLNWVGQAAIKANCDYIFCLGDFFDKSIVTDEEVTALSKINWPDIPQYFICGNHEASTADLKFSTLKCLEASNRHILTEVTHLTLEKGSDKVALTCLPYIIDPEKQKDVAQYKNPADNDVKSILLSHNDIAGISYGGFESKQGFSLDDLSKNFDLVLNGHLHNSEFVAKNVLNVGSFSAHNFTNDSFKYKYGAWILDISNNQISLKFIENPYSLQFYKVQILKDKDLSIFETIKKGHKLLPSAVISIQCVDALATKTLDELNKFKDIILESRLNIVRQNDSTTDLNIEDLHVNHLEKFVEFCRMQIDNSNILESELAEIIK